MLVTPSVRLVEPLGAGGMGAVWVADHLTLRTRVVVKFIGIELAARDDVRTRFSREAAAAAAVKSPHVVQMLDHGVVDDTPFIVMELLEGEDLRHRLERERVLSLDALDVILTQSCKALGQAHRAGIVHRDIKPDNIFLCKSDDGDTFVKLLDFGIAKKSDSTSMGATRTGAVIGTPYYMSPEQAIGAKGIDFRTDLWSLGVVAFEAMTGVRAFEGDNVGALVVAITHGRMPVPSQANASLPVAMDAWFVRACSRDASRRFASAKEMADAFHRGMVMVSKGRTVKMADAPRGRRKPEHALVEALSTDSPITTGDAEQRRSRPLLIAGGFALLGTVGLATWLYLSHREITVGATPSSSASGTSLALSATVSATATTAINLVPRHRCGPDVKTCSKTTVAWCDVNEHTIACCADGLVAVGKDGICDCAPGGYEGDGGPPTCKRSPAGSDDTVDAAIAAIRPRLRACLENARSSNSDLAGKMLVAVELTPEGDVFNARIAEGQMASTAAQSCVLDAVRAMQLAPPRSGGAKLTIPVAFGDQPTLPTAVPTGGATGRSAQRQVLLGAPLTGSAGGIDGGLSEDAIQHVVTQRAGGVKRTCWERGGGTESNVNVRVNITIAPNGTVQGATSEGNDPIVSKCIENSVRNWVFPASSGATNVDIPFHFLRQ